MVLAMHNRKLGLPMGRLDSVWLMLHVVDALLPLGMDPSLWRITCPS